MNKKLISIGLILTMIASTAVCGYAAEEADAAADVAAAEEITPDKISVTWDDSRVFTELTLGNYETITTYGVEGYEDVPFLSAHEYLDILFDGTEQGCGGELIVRSPSGMRE